MDTEMADKKDVDLRRAGGAMVVAGTLFLVMGVLVVLYDLPTLGGNVSGSRHQAIFLTFMTGILLLLAGMKAMEGEMKGGTETLSTPGPIGGDDGP